MDQDLPFFSKKVQGHAIYFLMKKKLCMYGERERKRVPAAGEHAMRCLCLAGESHKCDSALI